jgi:hypothetical protein
MDNKRAIELLKGQIEINQEWLKGMESEEDRKPFEELIEALEVAIDSIKLCEEHVVAIPLGERRPR